MAFELVRNVAKLLDDKKVQNLVCLEMQGRSDVCDYQLIGSGASTRQCSAMAKAMVDELKDQGIKPFAVEGLDKGNWVVVDYGSVIVHIFDQKLRDLYNIESVWPDAIKEIPRD